MPICGFSYNGKKYIFEVKKKEPWNTVFYHSRMHEKLMFNTTLNSISVISWQSVLLVEETEVPRENHQPIASH